MKRSRPWPESWKTGISAALFAALACAALAVAQLQPHHEGLVQITTRVSGQGYRYGWPLAAVRRLVVKNRPGQLPRTRYEVLGAGLLIDILVTASMVASTVVVAAYWLSRPQRWNQMSLFEWFAVTSVIAALVGIYINEKAIYAGLREPGRLPLHQMPAYAVVGLSLGISCTLLAAGRLTAQFFGRVFELRAQAARRAQRR